LGVTTGPQPNDKTGGTDKGKPKKVEDTFNVSTAGPSNGSIKITFEPKNHLNVGDEVELNARLSSPSGDLESIFYVKIVDPQQQQEKQREEKPQPPALPLPIRVYEKAENEGDITWEQYGWTGEEIVSVIRGDSENVVDGIAINMDSFVVKRYLSKNKISTEKGIKFVKDKYFTSVYLHSLFLYGIFDKLNRLGTESPYDLDDLIPSVMKPYSSFLLYENTDETILSSLKGD
jgi:hypothetical protein